MITQCYDIVSNKLTNDTISQRVVRKIDFMCSALLDTVINTFEINSL